MKLLLKWLQVHRSIGAVGMFCRVMVMLPAELTKPQMQQSPHLAVMLFI